MSKFTVDRVRLQRFEQSRLRWTIYRLRSESCIDLETDRIAARLHCRASGGHAWPPLIYDIIKVFDWARLNVDVIRQCRGWLSSAAELNSLGIQINAPILSSLFRHVFPAFPFLDPLSFFHVSLLLALLTPMNFITLRVSARERIRAHVAAFMHATYNSWSVSPMHSCTAYDALSLQQRPKVADSLERRIFRGTVEIEEKSVIETGRMYTGYIPIGLQI